MKKRMVAVVANPLHETYALGMFSSLFSGCLLTEDERKTDNQ